MQVCRPHTFIEGRNTKTGRATIVLALAVTLAFAFTADSGTPGGSGGDAVLSAGMIPDPEYTFTITRTGASFAATGTPGPITVPAGTIQSVIDAIDTGRETAVKKLIFGNGGTVDLGDGTAVLRNGTYIIEGNVTSAGGVSDATIRTENGASLYVDSEGASIGTASSGVAVLNDSVTGTVNISGGTVFGTGSSSYAVSNVTGTANISGGTIFTIGSGARSVSNVTGTVNISGGAISGMSGDTVCKASSGAVNISGGTITTATGNAVRNDSAGPVNISGGTISATAASGVAVYNNSAGEVNISGGVICAQCDAVFNSDTGIIRISGTAAITSACSGTMYAAIYLADRGSSSAVRLIIEGGTIGNVAGGVAVYNNSAGAIDIGGGTIVSSCTNSLYGTIYSSKAAPVNISGGTVLNTAGGKLINPLNGNVNVTAVPAKLTRGADVEKEYDGNAVTLAPEFRNLSVVVSAQWYKDGVPIDGATSMTHTVKNAGDSGEYVLKVTYAAAAGTTGTIESDPIAVKIAGPGGNVPVLLIAGIIAIAAAVGLAAYWFLIRKP